MDCCQCQGIEAVFDRRKADEELKQYRKDGPRKTTRLLLDALALAAVHISPPGTCLARPSFPPI